MDEETGVQVYKRVVQLFRNQIEEWYHIYANGEEIICTGGHPFYVAELNKFISARELEVGTKLLLSSGVCTIIEAIQTEQLTTPETTYNFEVEDFHTYYVGESSVLVHNVCKSSNSSELYMSREDAVKYGKEFLGDGYKKTKPGLYKSADELRVMHYDFTHHQYKGVRSPGHINLYTLKASARIGRFKKVENIHIFFY